MTQDQQLSTTLTCPKCGSDMRPYERNGVIIDQCTGCRGIFLDRGELERLTEAESAYYGSSRSTVPQAPERREYEDRGHDARKSGHGSERKRRPGGFLGELFD
ncbi:MAG: hypothetical protein B7X41_12270 [Microbacterium sp. 14-71-5]|jgi:Zn-finger nucleic acid-binding protein|nr:MAG: hypothetical protein B7X41_12270 [Microbacterium sp. 14-71-5]